MQELETLTQDLETLVRTQDLETLTQDLETLVESSLPVCPELIALAWFQCSGYC